MEECLLLPLTKEQRAILYQWYGHKRRDYCWDAADFIDGIIDVYRFYPDHRRLHSARESLVYSHYLESDDSAYEKLLEAARQDENTWDDEDDKNLMYFLDCLPKQLEFEDYEDDFCF
jgi:hypothetical protein